MAMASNSIIQSSSSSSHAKRIYDVFVSFRGEDTRNNFTGFLFQALSKKGIDSFKDDKHLQKGEAIAPELLQAIEGSRIFVVIFSKNYASSTWCLRELVEICNCIETSPRLVLPIFYDVDPSEVRKQSGCYEKHFLEYQEKFRGDQEKMQEVKRWRKTLTHVANLSGCDIRNKPHYAEIEEIVQKIINILGHNPACLPNDNLIGIESRVKELAKLLCLGSVNDVRVVGISGMSGIGKTTLGRALYERISHQYDSRCFIDDVSKIHQDSSTLGVQEQLLSQCLSERNLDICNVYEGTCLVWTRLRNARALIVLDNVDQIGQLKMFTGNRETLLHECLGGGSRVIIISRDECILRRYGVDDVYQVQPLDQENAVQLFCRNAFNGSYIVSDYEKLMYDVLSHAQGHPLAIEVLGSSLLGKNVSQWKSALVRLRENKSKNIMGMLRIGFDELDDIDKEIFLDIACFFNNYDEEQSVKEVLDFRGFHPEYGLQVLIAKSLISVHFGNIYMHVLLKDLGRFIVKEKSPMEPRKWNRLWDCQDFCKVMLDNVAVENLEGIAVQQDIKEFRESTIKVNALSKMSHLKLLKLHNVNFCGSLNHLSNELGYLTWNKYPFESLPPSFHPEKLVELSLSDSNIKQLWEDRKPLHNLRRLDLSYSKNLLKIPDFGETLNLEWLNLRGCIKIKQIHPSIGNLRKLVFLNLKDCRSLIKLPNFGEALNLETLHLKGCIKLKQINPSIVLLRKLTCLDLKDCKSLIKLPQFRDDLNLELLSVEGCIQLRKINPSICHLRKLTFLNLKDCKNLVSLPNNILCLNSLKYLNLSGCSKLFSIQLLKKPRDVENLQNLCIGEVPLLSQSTSSIMKRWFMLPFQLFYARTHKDSVICLPILSCIRQLDLSFCNLLQIPDFIGNLHCLERLNLSGNNFATLPNLKELSKLYYLNLQHCKHLKYLLELPSQTDLSSKTYKLPTPIVKSLAWGRVTLPSLKHLHDGREAGLNIFNCPELVDIEHYISMTISWMIHIIQEHHQCKYLWYETRWPPRMSSVIPGSEIPRWFNNQHASSLISLDTPPLMCDNTCIGVACCVVFAVRSGRGTVLGVSPPKVKTIRHLHAMIPVVLDEDLVIDQSDHMWLFYFTEIWASSLTLEIEIMVRQSFDLEVKKYGYRWIYEEDLELSQT